jgi:hypothetical protein
MVKSSSPKRGRGRPRKAHSSPKKALSPKHASPAKARSSPKPKRARKIRKTKIEKEFRYLSVVQLKALAKKDGLVGYSKLDRTALIKLLYDPPAANFKVDFLKKLCKEKGVVGYSKLHKDQLLRHCNLDKVKR